MKIRLLLAQGWTNRRIAQALRITGKTLQKHYFRDLRQRDEARPALEAERTTLLYEAMAKGNVGAAKELGRILEALDLRDPRLARRRREPKPAAPGKKQLLEEAAQTGHRDSDWGRDLEPSESLH